MLFADDIVLSRQNHREIEDDLQIWRNALERKSLKVSLSKTEYLKAGGVEGEEELKLQGEEAKRAKAGWISLKKVSGVLCDSKLSARVKDKMYKAVVRPAKKKKIKG